MGSYFDLVEFKELLVYLDDCSSGLSGLGDDALCSTDTEYSLPSDPAGTVENRLSLS